MFTLDAELRSDRCNLNNQKTKSEIKKELEESIANCNKNKNTDIEQNIVQRSKKMRQTLFTRTNKSSMTSSPLK